MANSETFKTLQKDASDTKYPQDNTVLRQAHADYARGIIARVRAEGGEVLSAHKAEGQYDKMSEAASRTTISQIISAIDELERYMDQQQTKANAGQTVGLIDGKGRHLLSNALVSLYFEMKDFYAAIGRGLVTEAGEIVLPASGEVADVTNKGTAVVENFLMKTVTV